MAKSKVYIPNNEEFKQLVEDNFSYSDCLRQLGLAAEGGSSSKILKKRIRELKCDVSHFDRTRTRKGYKSAYAIEDVFKEDSEYTNRKQIKKKLIEENIKKYECEICRISEWNGKPISLQLHHVNGVNNDHRIENLQLLCPNCHSQTDNYASKNSAKVKKPKHYCTKCGKEISGVGESGLCLSCIAKSRRTTERPSALELARKISETSFRVVGKEYGVSDKAIVKWCIAYGIPSHKAELKKWYKNKV